MIETTRGLPSFSELYNAYKNKGNLGQAINAGVEGYFDARKQVSGEAKTAAEAKEAAAHADYYKAQANGGIEKKVPLAALPEGAKAALAGYADAQGNVSEAAAKVYLANTAQGAAAEKATNELDLRTKQLEQNTKHAQEMAAVQQQLADLKAALGQSGQELSAAQTVANTTKGAAPSLAQKLMGKVGQATGIDAIVPDEYIKAQQNQAALDKLSGVAKMDHQIPVAERGVTPPTADMMVNPPAPKPVYPLSRNAKGTKNAPVTVTSRADYDKLPVGSWFVDSTGKPTQKR